MANRVANLEAQAKYLRMKKRRLINKRGFETPADCLTVKGKEKVKGGSKQPTGFNKVAQGADCVYGKLAITDAPTPSRGLVFGIPPEDNK
ncbi:hypothetical protein [Herbiconiux daphne]|uniref:Uncharacterized protein n=1 Tax=Herbiconiux daphne TaxID=2970914 RepID=A0ABT2HBE0_9MICO|nr:hypothetical protein [Herbiconiux daphne]MCS5737222.1 hypothetical protein [Herbiconiux daphne]